MSLAIKHNVCARVRLMAIYISQYPWICEVKVSVSPSPGRVIKDSLHEQFSWIGKAVANPKRIELLEDGLPEWRYAGFPVAVGMDG